MKRIRWIVGLIGAPFLLLFFYCSYLTVYAAIDQEWGKFQLCLILAIIGFVGTISAGLTMMFIDRRKKKDGQGK